ncbi:MAG: hypothetical protein ACI90V_006838, partial [Bacillariaceae sp.]
MLLLLKSFTVIKSRKIKMNQHYQHHFDEARGE